MEKYFAQILATKRRYGQVKIASAYFERTTPNQPRLFAS